MSSSDDSRHLAIELPEEELLRAFVEEGALNDRDLDEIEHRILGEEEGRDPSLVAALALTLGRAGRPRSSLSLDRARERLSDLGHADEAMVLSLALDLLQRRPPARVERADAGYRYEDPTTGLPLYVEDPVAAHWHQQGRWGPPLRPDLDRAPVIAGADDDSERLMGLVSEGRVVIVCFRPGRLWGQPARPLRLTLAGLARDPGLKSMTRWSQVSSIGLVGGGRRARAALEISGGPLEVLPARPIFALDGLMDLMGRLLKRARS